MGDSVSDAGIDGDETLPPDHHTPGASQSRSREEGLEAGARLGRYLIRGVVGAGGLGTVYEAWDPALDRSVAIKLLHERTGRARSSSLLKEAQAMARINDPNVVTVHDVGLFDQRLYLAMELVDGVTLTQWCTEERTVAQKVDVVRQMARGLVAVHEAGLVHRDFKPANVMVRTDGRAQVMDFGLARADDEDDSTAGGSQTIRRGADETLGGGVGTPAYMAPEQHLGGTGTALSDQYALCVTAYEVLHGIRAFRAESFAMLSLKVIEGKIEAPPAGTKIPAPVLRAIMRGLASRPADRFASVTDLLRAIDRGGYRRVWLWASGLAACSILGAWSLYRSEDRCEHAGVRVEDVWNDERRHAVAGAFEATGLEYAPDGLRTATDELDRWTGAWAAAAVQACEAAQRGELAPERFDQTMACLRRRLDDASELIDVLATADPVVVRNGASAAMRLPPARGCLASTSPAAHTADPDQMRGIESTQRVLARVDALHLAGKDDEAVVLARQAVQQAEETSHRPTIVEARTKLAGIEAELGNLSEAERLLTDAYLSAIEIGGDRQALKAALQLAYYIGYRGQRLDDGRKWLRDADAALSRTDDATWERVALVRLRGTLSMVAGDMQAAQKSFSDAVALGTKLLDRDHHETVLALQHLGTVKLRRRMFDEAEPLLRRVLEVHSAQLGPRHPDTGKVAANLGALEVYRSRPEQAVVHLEAAEAALRDRPADVGLVLTNLAVVYGQLGRHDEARQMQQRAVEALQAAYGEDHPMTLTAQYNVALTLTQEGDASRGLELHQRVLEARSRALGPEHPDVLHSYFGLSLALLQVGRAEEALEAAQRAHEIATTTETSPSLLEARALAAVGEARLALGQHEDARRAIQQSLQIRKSQAGEDHASVGESQMQLARVYLAAGDPQQAVTEARDALAVARAAEQRGYEDKQDQIWITMASSLWARANEGDRIEARRLVRERLDRATQTGQGTTELQTWLREHPAP